MKIPQIIYLNPETVEENWSLIREDGIEESRVQEISDKLKIGAKIGFGNFISNFIADIKASGSIGHEAKDKVNIKYPNPIKLFFLKNTIPNIKELRYELYDDFENLETGQFVNILLPRFFFHPIPTRSELHLLSLLEGFEPSEETEKEMSNLQTLISVSKDLSLISNAMQFAEEIESSNSYLTKDNGSPLGQIYQEYQDEFENLLNLSTGDTVVGVTKVNHLNHFTYFLVNMKNQYLRSNIASYLSNQEFFLFGRVTTCKRKDENYIGKKHSFIGIDPIAISLE